MNDTHHANPGYALGRLRAAMDTLERHPDAETRARAAGKVARWREVLAGMQSGALRVGARAPVEGTPTWVTLDVAHGGFATGRLLAEGALRDHERAQLAALPAEAPGETPRERLNLWLLSDAGLGQLDELLRSGGYRVDVPEEGALLVVAWLLGRGESAAALELVELLRPWMARLRFYPRPAPPRASSASVHVATAGEVATRLSAARPQAQVAAMNATLRIWNPLADRLVALWLETVEGEPPRLEGGAVEGGWPCRRWPDDWGARRKAWLRDFAAAEHRHGLTGKHAHPKSNFQRLLHALERCADGSKALRARDVGALRRALANVGHRHGLPGAPGHDALRAEQARIGARPLHAHVAHALAERLRALPADEGIGDLASIVRPIEAEESAKVPEGSTVPEAHVARISRALEAPAAELVERGVIGSSEVLAGVLPQIGARVAAAQITDPAARALHEALYAAFRRRRSVLLLHLERQVRFEELPWVSALDVARSASADATETARATLGDVAQLALTAFPHTILPNPLVRELGALAERTDVDLPLVEEVAADIFMGDFTSKWGRAAGVACELLRGSLYARYYDLPASWVTGGDAERWGRRVDAAFGHLCAGRAQEAGSDGSFVAKNGATLEQAQILTTHGLASLVARLELEETMRERGFELAERSLRWAIEHQARPAPHVHARLRATKNAAYAWRQALFFLSFVPEARQRDALGVIEESLAGLEARAKLEPALLGLRDVLDGHRFDSAGRSPSGGRRLLGWAVGSHWAL